MQRILAGLMILLLAIGLVACGGGDGDDADTDAGDDGSGTTSATTAAESEDDAPEVVQTEEAAESEVDDSGGMPNVTVPLAVGSGGEVQSDNPDPLQITGTGPELGPLKVTVNAITDNATTDSEIFQPAAGNKYWALEVTMEAIGDKIVNTGFWYLHTADGTTYETVLLTGVGEDIIYGAIEPGQSTTGVVVFEIPQDAQIADVTLDPNIYVGSDLIFEAE